LKSWRGGGTVEKWWFFGDTIGGIPGVNEKVGLKSPPGQGRYSKRGENKFWISKSEGKRSEERRGTFGRRSWNELFSSPEEIRIERKTRAKRKGGIKVCEWNRKMGHLGEHPGKEKKTTNIFLREVQLKFPNFANRGQVEQCLSELDREVLGIKGGKDHENLGNVVASEGEVYIAATVLREGGEWVWV